MSKKSIVKSAFVLTVAGLITRLLGFVYRIYMSNAVGAEGIGLYQLIMPVYSLAWSISCSGFTTTISKLTAQEKARGEYGNMGKILKICLVISCSISVVLSVLLFLFAGDIAVYFFKDNRIVLAMKILAFCFPFMAAGSCIRGYFLGLQETLIPAINQVLEQCIRMTVIYLLAGTFIPMGLDYACAACVIGIFAEEFFSFFYIVASYNHFKKKNKYFKHPSLNLGVSLGMIMSMALPLTANRVSSSLLSTLENILIPQRLQIFGSSSKEAMAAFGQITGMAMPLIYFPSAFLVSLSISLVPAISEAAAVKNLHRMTSMISKTLSFTMIVGIGAAAVVTIFSGELGQIIYNQDLERILLLLGFMCPFLYTQMILSGILNGLGHQIFIFKNSLLSSVINILFIYFLVPYKGVDGFILGWFVSIVIVTALDLEKVRKSVTLEVDFVNWILKPLLSGLASALTIKLVAKNYLFTMFGDIPGLIISVGLLCVAYLGLILLTGCISMQDLKSLRKG